MAGNALITQQVGPVCSQALGLLHTQILLPSLLRFDTGVSGSLAVGDTVNVRKPASFAAKAFNRATGIEIQDIVETTVPVKIDKIWDVSVALTAEQVTLSLTNFGQQVTYPATIALAEKAEALCIDILKTATLTADILVASPVQSLIDAVAILNANKVSMANRNIVVGTTMAAALKKSENLLRVDASGSSDALRNAIIGRVAGATVYESPYVGAEEGFLFGQDAAVFVSRAMETMGGTASAQTFEGVAMRTVIDYDVQKKQTVASFDMLTGGALLTSEAVVKLALNDSAVPVVAAATTK
jgi:hypothetical protein